MCRWIAYTGDAVFIDQIVTLPKHSLVEQSKNTKLNFAPDGQLMSINGDGFGIGWYGQREDPGLFKDENPAWSDRNLRNICEQIKAHTFFAHVRAATNGAVQRTNCHPFKYKNWLFQHNGHVSHFEIMRQELQSDIAPELFPYLLGTTDSETLFYLALTYGLEKNPKDALRKMVRRIEAALDDLKAEGPLNLSISLSDGKSIYALRYARNDTPKTQFYCEDMDWIESVGSEKPKQGVVLVSEPLNHLDFHWQAIPENGFSVIEDGKVHIEDFM